MDTCKGDQLDMAVPPKRLVVTTDVVERSRHSTMTNRGSTFALTLKIEGLLDSEFFV